IQDALSDGGDADEVKSMQGIEDSAEDPVSEGQGQVYSRQQDCYPGRRVQLWWNAEYFGCGEREANARNEYQSGNPKPKPKSSRDRFARFLMKSARLVRGYKANDGPADPEIQKCHVRHNGTDQNPYAIGDAAQVMDDVRRDENPPGTGQDEPAPVPGGP